MDHLEHPTLQIWEKRKGCFESMNEQAQGRGGCFFLSEQACALTADVQATFCAGAWSAVIIMTVAVVDAALRETELPGFTGNTQRLLTEAGANPKLQELRRRRNALVHLNPENPAITFEHQWFNRDQLEAEARQAVELMFEAFYLSPGT
jgi:hypothetical protein